MLTDFSFTQFCIKKLQRKIIPYQNQTNFGRFMPNELGQSVSGQLIYLKFRISARWSRQSFNPTGQPACIENRFLTNQRPMKNRRSLIRALNSIIKINFQSLNCFFFEVTCEINNYCVNFQFLIFYISVDVLPPQHLPTEEWSRKKNTLLYSN